MIDKPLRWKLFSFLRFKLHYTHIFHSFKGAYHGLCAVITNVIMARFYLIETWWYAKVSFAKVINLDHVIGSKVSIFKYLCKQTFEYEHKYSVADCTALCRYYHVYAFM